MGSASLVQASRSLCRCFQQLCGAMGSSSSRMSSTDEAVRTWVPNLCFLMLRVSFLPVFSCHSPVRTTLQIAQAMQQMQHGVVPAPAPPTDGPAPLAGGATPTAPGASPNAGDHASPATGDVSFVRLCSRCGKMAYFREHCCLNPECASRWLCKFFWLRGPLLVNRVFIFWFSLVGSKMRHWHGFIAQILMF